MITNQKHVHKGQIVGHLPLGHIFGFCKKLEKPKGFGFPLEYKVNWSATSYLHDDCKWHKRDY